MNTLKSHCLLEYAKSVDCQNETAEVLFHVYFEEGKDINNKAVLKEVCKCANLDENEAMKCIEDEKLKTSIYGEAKHAHHRGINGVPFFDIYIDGINEKKPLSFSGAQGPAVFTDIFRRLLNTLKSKA